MNANEYGVVLGFFVAYDISGFTGVSIEFWAPGLNPLSDPPTWTKTSPDVSVPNVPFVTPGVEFPANQYAQYTSIQGDFVLPGTWSARVIYDVTSPAQQLISNVGTFLVGP